MITDDTKVQVQNLTGSTVGYFTFEGRRRVFRGQQTLPITAGELRQLSFTTGGEYLIKNCLSVKNKELAEELGVSTDSFENEYNWTVKDVDNLLLKGSKDALADALDFAPAGIIDLIIDRAVYLELNDLAKRKMISESTGSDINIKIENKIKGQEANKPEEPKKKTRRVKQEKTVENSGRRVKKQVINETADEEGSVSEE